MNDRKFNTGFRAFHKFYAKPKNKQGSALILALWSVILLSLLVSSLAFHMHMEAKLTVYHRKRFKAHKLAQSGIEWAKFMVFKSLSGFKDEDTYGEDFRIRTLNLNKGMALKGVEPNPGLGEFNGTFKVDIIPEQGRRNVNYLERIDWKEILDRSGVPDEEWDSLIDAFLDWTDENDLHHANGAESDDSFYRDAGYEVKNAKLDTINELLLIKGFTESIVYGGPSEDDEEISYTGIAQWLTTFGDGKLNINTATRDVLMTLPEIEEHLVDDMLQRRLGPDGVPGTEDDGFSSVSESGFPNTSRLTVKERRYIRIVSIGEVEEVKTGIWSIFLQQGRDLVPIFWREEQMP